MSIIKTQLLNGVLYTALAKYAGIIVQLVVTAILARLLTPEEFGVVAICTVVIAFFNQFTEMGVGVAIIQRQDLSLKDYDQLFSFSIYFGLFIGLLFFLSSYPISIWFHDSKLYLYLQLLTIQLIFNTFNMVPNALLLKAKKFKFIAERTLVLQILTGLFACVAAYYGGGGYSLLISPILTSIGVFFINLRYSNLHFKYKFSFTPLRKIFSYSFYQFAFGMVNYFSRNLDKILTGKYIGMNLLGYYEKSYRLVLLPMQNITGVINPVVQPILAEYQDDKVRLGNYLLRILKSINMICFPISVIAFFCSKEIILLFFGPQWTAAVPCFQILCISIGFQAANHITGAFFQVANSTKGLFWTGLLSAIEYIVAFAIAIILWNSIEAVAAAVSFVFTVSFFQTFSILFGCIYQNMIKTFFMSLISPTLVSLFLIVALLPTLLWSTNNLWLTTSYKVTISIIVLLAYYQMSGYLPLSKIWTMIRRNKTKGATIKLPQTKDKCNSAS